MTEIVVATGNMGKLREIGRALEGTGITVKGLKDFPGAPEVEEDGETFRENAVKKARAIAEFTGLPALADDSGLAVDSLGGRPGVYSARYAGENATDAENNEKLLAELAVAPPEKRTARFVAVLVVAVPGGELLEARGECGGEILQHPKGENGFGYDPLFLYKPLNKTFAEMTDDEKLSVSHRGRALEELKKKLPDWLHKHNN